MIQSGERFEGEEVAGQDSAIAIVGMACRFAGAPGLDAYWTLLRDGVEAIETFDDDALAAAGVLPAQLRDPGYVRRAAPLRDMESFDAGLFGLSPRDAAIMDPQHRHFLECCWEALEDAGHDPHRFPGAIGLFGGSGHNAYLPYNLLSNPKLVRDTGLFLLRHTGNDKDFMTTRVSYLLDLKGPSISVQTACSTSLVAVHMASQSLLGGECDLVLAGGASIELPHRQGYLFEPGGILSPDGRCRPFDARSQGTVFGSGVAVVALRRLGDAIASGDRIYAVVRGSAINNDGSGKVGYLAPSVDGQARAIAEALDIAEVDPATVAYVEAHGTGTPVGDPIEVAALSQAFGLAGTNTARRCGIGSVKANIGHTDTAAGAAGLIKVALAMHHGELPATINFTAPNPDCGFEAGPFRVQDRREPWPRVPGEPRRAGVSSLGVGGTNAHVVLEEAPADMAAGPSRPIQILPISAQSAASLDANTTALADHLATGRCASLADAAFTLSVGRQALGKRRVALAAEAGDAAEILRTLTDESSFTADAVADRPVAFLFAGGGAQHVAMARGLYDREESVRATVDECLACLDRLGIHGVRRWLLPVDADLEEAAAMMDRPSVALPALFIVQVAVARFWMRMGVKPDGMIGHSSGEYAAAHLAGVVSLEAALRIVSARGRLFERVAPGGMLSIPMSEEELLPHLSDELSIAAINAPRLCVASGPADAIEALRLRLAEEEVETQSVRISVAAHSAMLDPILPEFRRLLNEISFAPPRIRFASNLTGDWITAAEATDPEYWVRHLRRTVRFTEGLRLLLDDKDRVLLEVGPGRSMASLARQHSERARAQPVLSSLRHPQEIVDDQVFTLTTLGRLWALGAPVDWAAFWDGQQRRRISLPTYRFDRQRHWIDPGTAAFDPGAAADAEKRLEMSNWMYEPHWTRAPLPRSNGGTGPALIFEDAAGVGAAVAAALRAEGRIVSTVRPGRAFRRRSDDHFTCRPTSAADMERLFDALSEAGSSPTQVFHCWQITATGRFQRKPNAERLTEIGFNNLLALAPILARQTNGSIDLVIATNRLHRVAAEECSLPEKAMTLGAARVIATEYPELRVRTVDIECRARSSDVDLARTARALLDEAGGGPEPDPIALRAGERWVRRFVPVAESVSDEGTAIRPDGVYLITGGLGGVGLAVAEHLVRDCGATVVLVSRTALPPRESWAELLVELSSNHPTAQRLRRLLALEGSGGRVEVIAADICDRRATRQVTRTVRECFGPITGVFHAAGTLDDGLIENKTRHGTAAVLRPKVAGTSSLQAALADEPPEFVVLFSSVSAFAGIAGQADYAAANAFLDAVAQSHHGDPRIRWISVAWSQWRDTGMAAGLGTAEGRDEFEPVVEAGAALAHPFLREIHMLSPDHFVATGSLSPKADWLLDEHRVGDRFVLPGTGYLDLVLTAFAASEDGPAILGNVTFLAPFSVPDGTARELRIVFDRDDGDWRFRVIGRPADAPDTSWTEHAAGLIGAGGASSDPAPLDLDAIRDRCRAAPPIAPTDHSPRLRLGPRWQNVLHAAHGPKEAVLTLALPDRFAGDLEQMVLHPALLDIATAGAQSLIPGLDPACDFYAPFSYGQVHVLAPLPARVLSHIRYRSNSSAGRSLAVFDVTIADPSGTVVAEVTGFTMIRLREGALLAAETESAPAFPVRGGPERPAVLREAMTVTEGVRMLDRILASRTGAHLVVSPFALTHAIATLSKPGRSAGASGRSNGSDVGEQRLTPTEGVIVELWKDLLDIEGISRLDDFFDLGGHSLLAVQFINRLRKRTGKTLPLAAMLDMPTVERLARLLSPDEVPEGAGESSPDTSPAHDLVVIRSGGTGVPLFLVHDGLGETLLYRGLALRLAGDRPILGIEPGRLPDGAFAQTRISEMAAAYIFRIKAAQSHGPYLLAGLCAGGVIAFEMARQMESAGDAVTFVGIIDAADVAASKRRHYATRLRLSRLREMMGEIGPGLMPKLARRVWNVVAYEIGSRLDMARRRRAVSLMQARGSADDAASPAAGLAFLQLYEVAHRAHRPQSVITSAEVVLFKATSGDGTLEDTPYQEIYADVILGWGKRVSDDLLVEPVPGGHSSALQEPHVAELASRFQLRLDSALARYEARVSRPAAANDEVDLGDPAHAELIEAAE